jgi:hypothetical protein
MEMSKSPLTGAAPLAYAAAQMKPVAIQVLTVIVVVCDDAVGSCGA